MGRLNPARVLALASLAALAAGCTGSGRMQRSSEIPEIHDPGPSRTTPMPGAAPDPIRPGPQGSMPNPYVRPN